MGAGVCVVRTIVKGVPATMWRQWHIVDAKQARSYNGKRAGTGESLLTIGFLDVGARDYTISSYLSN